MQCEECGASASAFDSQCGRCGADVTAGDHTEFATLEDRQAWQAWQQDDPSDGGLGRAMGAAGRFVVGVVGYQVLRSQLRSDIERGVRNSRR